MAAEGPKAKKLKLSEEKEKETEKTESPTKKTPAELR